MSIMKKELFYKDPCIIIYIPGYMSGESTQDEVIDAIEKLYECDKHPYGGPHVIVFNWESVASYAMALHNSIAAANDLIEYLKELPCTPDVTVIGHSLGALVVTNAMKRIPANAYYRAKQVILLGAAMDAHANLTHMCNITDYPVINVVNHDDVVLSTLYRTYNDSPALGQVGSYCKHNKNYVELKVLPSAIKGSNINSLEEMANQLLNATGHSASRVYLNSLVTGNYIVNK